MSITKQFNELIDKAEPRELELRPRFGSLKHSPCLMAKAPCMEFRPELRFDPENSPKRPPVGLQGMILDAMDDGRLTRPEASTLLDRIHARLSPGSPGMQRVTESGELVPMKVGG